MAVRPSVPDDALTDCHIYTPAGQTPRRVFRSVFCPIFASFRLFFPLYVVWRQLRLVNVPRTLASCCPMQMFYTHTSREGKGRRRKWTKNVPDRMADVHRHRTYTYYSIYSRYWVSKCIARTPINRIYGLCKGDEEKEETFQDRFGSYVYILDLEEINYGDGSLDRAMHSFRVPLIFHSPSAF